VLATAEKQQNLSEMDPWQERYSRPEYIYGVSPNEFFAAELTKLPPGIIVMPCEGEGRNAVFAAKNGWVVSAVDGSAAGKEKAMKLAVTNGVEIEYTVTDMMDCDYPPNSADVVAFIFAHFPAAIRSSIHQKAISWLKPGGRIILEAFHPRQLPLKSGGPKDIDMLYTAELLAADFQMLDTLLLQSTQTTLNEGPLHQGIAEVVRYVGVKN